MSRFRSKFRNKPTEYQGRRYASKKEAAFAASLDEEQKAGRVLCWLPQVPIPLPGGVKYVADFLVFYANGECAFIDVKGTITPMFALKKKQVEALYPFVIEVV